MKIDVDLIIQIIKLSNILQSNPYAFALQFKVEEIYRGTNWLRDAASKYGAFSPELLRSTW